MNKGVLGLVVSIPVLCIYSFFIDHIISSKSVY